VNHLFLDLADPDLAESDFESTGGKAVGIAMLSRAGLPVPKSVVLPVSLLVKGGAGKGRPAPQELQLFPGAVESIRQAYSYLGAKTVAVRSSADNEDRRRSSSAGRYYTALDVEGPKRVVKEVRTCLVSLARHCDDFFESGVIIQEYIEPDASGILFTRDPVGPADRIIIEAVPGPGGQPVGPSKSPERYVLDRKSFNVLDFVASKNRGSTIPTGPAGLLSGNVLKKLRRMAVRAVDTSGNGADLDIEWIVKAGRIWLVQARPIVLEPGERSPASTIGDRVRPNYRDMESLSRGLYSRIMADQLWHGPVTPMMFDLAGRAIEKEMIERPLALGLGENLKGRMLCLYYGRVFVALEPVRKVLSLLPGVLVGPELQGLFPGGIFEGHKGRFKVSKTGDPLKLAVALSKFAFSGNPLTPLGAARAFEAMPEPRVMPDPLEVTRPVQALEAIRDELEIFLSKSAWVVGWAYVLDSMFRRLLGTAWDHVCKARSSAADMEQDFVRLVSKWKQASLKEKKEAKKILFAYPDSISSPAAGPARVMREFLERHGHRALARDIFVPRLGEESGFVLDLLERWNESGHVGKKHETRLDDTKIPNLVMRQVLNPLLKLSCRLVGLREEMRRRADAYLFRMRSACLELGGQLESEGRLRDRNDVFFLTMKEAADSLNRSMDVLARERKKDYKLFATVRVPGWIMDGEPLAETWRMGQGESQMSLSGTPVSAGKSRGRARVIRSFRDLVLVEEGDVLVTQACDPSWAIVFGRCSAVVTELGGTLSHAAISAREHGLPAVAGVAGLLDYIGDGDVVFVDGFSGRVAIERKMARSL